MKIMIPLGMVLYGCAALLSIWLVAGCVEAWREFGKDGINFQGVAAAIALIGMLIAFGRIL